MSRSTPSLPPVHVRPQRAERRTIRAPVPVVDRDGRPVHPRHRVGPGGVAWSSVLGALSRLAQRPPGAQPRRVVRVAERLGARGRVDEHLAGRAVLVHLDDHARNVVQPLVGDQQPVDVRRQVAPPGDAVGQVAGSGGQLDAHQVDAGQQVGQCSEQLAAPGPHVDHRGRRRPAGQLGDRLGEAGHVRAGAEVLSRPRPHEEAVVAVQGPPPGVPPGHGLIGHSTNLVTRR
jgi:hypothetical protein